MKFENNIEQYTIFHNSIKGVHKLTLNNLKEFKVLLQIYFNLNYRKLFKSYFYLEINP